MEIYNTFDKPHVEADRLLPSQPQWHSHMGGGSAAAPAGTELPAPPLPADFTKLSLSKWNAQGRNDFPLMVR